MQQRWTILAAGLTVCFLLEPASAQVIIDGGRARANVTAGSVANRRPGNMVSRGVARTVERADDIMSLPEITETEAPRSFRSLFLAEAVTIIFEDLNQAIRLLHNALLIRGGRQPLPLDQLIPPIGDLDPDDSEDESTDDNRDVRAG